MRRALSRCLASHLQPFYSQGAAVAALLTSGAAHQQCQLQRCQAVSGLQQQSQCRDRTSDASCSPSCEQAGFTQQQQHHHHGLQPHQQQQQQQQQHHTRSRISSLASLQQPHAAGSHHQQQPHASSSLLHPQQQQQQQSLRGFASRVQVNPTMPPELATVITEHAAIKAERPPAPPLEPRPLLFESRRSGVIAIKAGMLQDWDEFGVRVPLTVLWIDECMVLRHKHIERDGVTSLVLACGAKREKQLHPRQLGEFQAAGLPLKRKLWECRVSDDAVMPPGTLIGAAHFRAGQYLDITGTSKGKGFAGVMKRWNFAGQNATHGNTKHHRAPGSIGGRTDPGRVWKGKKMPGRLGGETKTFKNIWLYKVDPERNLLFVRGQVPGPQGSFVLVRDAFRWKWAERQAAELPFPTHIGDTLPPVAVAKRDGGDPYRVYREDIGYFEANWKGD